jgi:hypothetical protein
VGVFVLEVLMLRGKIMGENESGGDDREMRIGKKMDGKGRSERLA